LHHLPSPKAVDDGVGGQHLPKPLKIARPRRTLLLQLLDEVLNSHPWRWSHASLAQAHAKRVEPLTHGNHRFFALRTEGVVLSLQLWAPSILPLPVLLHQVSP
jgi:hypothetical protein